MVSGYPADNTDIEQFHHHRKFYGTALPQRVLAPDGAHVGNLEEDSKVPTSRTTELGPRHPE